jgi:tetratricopeptide (TPR) repeat protein
MKKRTYIIGLLLLILTSQIANGQSQKKKAIEKGKEAISLMDNGKFEESIVLLEDAQKLDPDNINYPYEIGYALYSMKEYKKAGKMLEGLTKHKDVNDRVFQLLGNCYDNLENSNKAIETYEKGLKVFPNSGSLHLELGVVQIGKSDYNKALTYFEKGIIAEPTFSSNYYWAAKLYCGSTEEVWGMIYGELFMNLERNSKRTSEISKLLYNTYNSEIKFTSDSSFSVSFSKNATINIDDLGKQGDVKMPFGVGVYEPTLMFSMMSAKTISLNSLDSIRTNFVDLYYSKGFDKTYPNALFAYQKRVKDAGHLEAYNHWVLMKGNETAFGKWMDSNKTKWDNFVKWFGENGIVLTESNKFYRSQY